VASPSRLYLVAPVLAVLLSACQRSAPSADEPERTVGGTLGKRLDSQLLTYERQGFSGSVLTAVRGKVVLHAGYGFADLEARKPNEAGTLYEMASITKTLTAAAILRLESEGRLATTDRISRFLGPFPPPKDQATVHHLATHTAGLVVEGTDLYSGPDRDRFLSELKSVPAESPPGKRYRYTNAGYAVLAAIIDTAAGETFEQYIHRVFLRPAGMSPAGFLTEAADTSPRRARQYAASPQGPVAARPDEYGWGNRGATGLVASVSDIYRWVLALDTGTVLTPAARKKMFTPWSEESYGWHTDTTEGRLRRHKGGGLKHGATQILWFPDDDVIIVWASNNVQKRWRQELNRTLTGHVFTDYSSATR
jgi:CubicO group peptidase (beta-lactamase class C family)